MTDLNQAIANSVNLANANFTEIAKFVEEQAPSLFQELLVWNTFRNEFFQNPLFALGE